MKKSIKLNAIFSLIQSISTIIFPLITFPYISRIFGVDQLGKYNYAKNFVEIFATFAMLGIPTYAQREGARLRNNKEKLNKLMSELFSFSMLSNCITLVILYIITFSVDTFSKYSLLILIFSVTIPMTSIGMSWIFVIFEDYDFTTFIGILFNIISIISMFIFVKNKQDMYLYALITVIASCGANIIKFFYLKKYCKVSLTLHIDLKKHIKPIVLMFSAYISIMIYNRTDTALLGVMASDYNVGIYSVSTKIYNLVKSCLLALSTVIQTRAVILADRGNKSNSDKFLSKCFNMMMTFVIPCMVGMAFMNKDIILFISGVDYLKAGMSMIILSVSLFFALFSTMQSSCILIPYGKEKTTLYGAVAGAIVNLILNMGFIPLWKENGAALTTLIAEITVFSIYYAEAKKYFTHLNRWKTIIQCGVGSIGIIMVLYLLRNLEINIIPRIIIKIGCSAIIYFLIQILVGNDAITEIYDNILVRLKEIKCGKRKS